MKHRQYLIWMLSFLLLPVTSSHAGRAAITGPVTGLVAGQGPVTATDYFGRTLTLERPADRFACLYAFTGHVITLLGRGHDMVAVVDGLKKRQADPAAGARHRYVAHPCQRGCHSH